MEREKEGLEEKYLSRGLLRRARRTLLSCSLWLGFEIFLLSFYVVYIAEEKVEDGRRRRRKKVYKAPVIFGGSWRARSVFLHVASHSGAPETVRLIGLCTASFFLLFSLSLLQCCFSLFLNFYKVHMLTETLKI